MDNIVNQKFVVTEQVHLLKNTFDVAVDILRLEIELIRFQFLDLLFRDTMSRGAGGTIFQEFGTISTRVLSIGLWKNKFLIENLQKSTYKSWVFIYSPKQQRQLIQSRISSLTIFLFKIFIFLSLPSFTSKSLVKQKWNDLIYCWIKTFSITDNRSAGFIIGFSQFHIFLCL